MGEGFRESRLYEMRMLCREFFPGAEIRQEPCDWNIIWKDEMWTLTEKNGKYSGQGLLKRRMFLEILAEIWREPGESRAVFIIEGTDRKRDPMGHPDRSTSYENGL